MHDATLPHGPRPVPLPARTDIAVIGGGILGLAVARELLSRRPGLQVTVLEREVELSSHQTGHNSGVLHAGLYYTPGSLKQRYCRDGKAALERYADERGIPYERCGKLVVAVDDAELPALEKLRERAAANMVPGLEVVGPERIAEIEPHVRAVRGLWSPGTAIIDYRRVALSYADDVLAAGGSIHTGHEVRAIRPDASELTVVTDAGDLHARAVIGCAGLWADQVASMTPGAGTERIIPFRGDYYTLTPDARSLVRGLVYPVPDPRFPFLGVHFTRRIDGEVWAGPNAVLAFARTGYRRRDVSVRDLAGVLGSRGFLRLAARFWKTGAAEMWRDWSKASFAAELQRFIPELRGDQLTFGPSGIRAQAVDLDGTMVDDFRFRGGDRVLHVVNAPSPAATSSLAIAADVGARAIERFGL
ncbi:MAG: L-2-hydroxyglutarate oxidase [Candidatus Limnocylindrales bacterium]